MLFNQYSIFIPNKSENATPLLLVKMAEKRCCKKMKFSCVFHVISKSKTRAIFELEYMCSIFTFVQYSIYIFICVTVNDFKFLSMKVDFSCLFFVKNFFFLYPHLCWKCLKATLNFMFHDSKPLLHSF